MRESHHPSTNVEAVLNSTPSITAFLSAFIPDSAAHGPVTPDMVRAGLRHDLGAEAGVHYEEEWLLAQLEHTLATAPPVPVSIAAMWQDGLQADRERRQGLKRSRDGCETAPSGGAGASGPTDAVAGSAAASVLLDPAPDPSAEPPTDAGGSAAASRSKVDPIVDANGRDITSLELVIPPGAKPEGFFSFTLHHEASSSGADSTI